MNWAATPKRSAMYGTSGIRMPNPNVSMMQNRNSAASGRRNVGIPLRLVTGDEGGHPSGLGRRWHVVARRADDEVGHGAIAPRGVASAGRAGAQDGQLQRWHQPQPVAALPLHDEHVGRGV